MMQDLWTACGPVSASGATARLPAGQGERRRGAARSCSGPSGAAGSARARRWSPGAAGPGRSARPEVSIVLVKVFYFRLDNLTVCTVEYMYSTHNMLYAVVAYSSIFTVGIVKTCTQGTHALVFCTWK